MDKEWKHWLLSPAPNKDNIWFNFQSDFNPIYVMCKFEMNDKNIFPRSYNIDPAPVETETLFLTKLWHLKHLKRWVLGDLNFINDWENSKSPLYVQIFNCFITFTPKPKDIFMWWKIKKSVLVIGVLFLQHTALFPLSCWMCGCSSAVSAVQSGSAADSLLRCITPL